MGIPTLHTPWNIDMVVKTDKTLFSFSVKTLVLMFAADNYIYAMDVILTNFTEDAVS